MGHGYHMKISTVKNKVAITVFACISALYTALAIILGVNVFAALPIGALMFGALFVRFDFSCEKCARFSYLIIGAAALITFAGAQLVCGALFDMGILKAVLNLILIYGAFAVFCALTGSVKAGIIIFYSLSIFLAFLDFFVVQTRNFEIQLSDLFSVTTGLSVVADYKYSITPGAAAVLLISITILVFVCVNPYPRIRGFLKRSITAGAGALMVAAIFALAVTDTGLEMINFRTSYYKYQMSTYNGFFLGVAKSFGKSTISEPDGYSASKTDKSIGEIIGESEPDGEPRKFPDVIVIMDETFTDLEYVCRERGYDLGASEDPLAFFHSLDDSEKNIIKGYLYSSVFGGNTANSEFEFLTSNSMAFVDTMVVPYNGMLNDKTAFSLVDLFNSYGYRTIGMHPENKNNYHRTKIYRSLGFDEQYFLENNTFVDGKEITEDEIYRGNVTDRAVFDRIIGLIEDDSSDPAFVFAVTMQNHGGYGVRNEEWDISAGGYTALEEFLSTVRRSDRDLEYLIDHVKKSGRDTVIVYFGDHQPSIGDRFNSEYYGCSEESSVEENQCRYIVPYLIYANYDLPDDAGDGYTTSINYLGTRLIDLLGFRKSDYVKLVEEVQRKVPAINTFGWWDSDYIFHAIETVKDVKAGSLEKGTPEYLLYVYYCAEYNMLADRSKLGHRFSYD